MELKVSVTQSCLTLCNAMDCSPPGSFVHRILQARILEWTAVPSSRGSPRPRDRTHISYSSCAAGGFFTTELPPLPLGYPGEAQSSRTCVLLFKRTLYNQQTPKTHTCTEGGPCQDPERGPPSPSQRERPWERLPLPAS